MSHTVSYKHLAVRFPHSDLNAVLPEARFYQDQFILIECIGDNNLTTTNPYTSREVGHRHCAVMGYGSEVDVIRQGIRCSVFCEGYDLRLYGDRITTPEFYIKRVRNAVKNPVPLKIIQDNAFTLTVRLETKDPVRHVEEIERLNALVGESKKDDGSSFWALHPFRNLLHTAILMRYGFIDHRASFEIAKAEGPEFEQAAREIFKWPLKKAA